MTRRKGSEGNAAGVPFLQAAAARWCCGTCDPVSAAVPMSKVTSTEPSRAYMVAAPRESPLRNWLPAELASTVGQVPLAARRVAYSPGDQRTGMAPTAISSAAVLMGLLLPGSARCQRITSHDPCIGPPTPEFAALTLASTRTDRRALVL